MHFSSSENYFLFIVFFILIFCLMYYIKYANIVNINSIELFTDKNCIFDYVHYYEHNNLHFIEVKDKHGNINKDSFKTKEEAFNIWNNNVKAQPELIKDCIVIDLTNDKEKIHLNNEICIFDYVHYYESPEGEHIIEVKDKKSGNIKKAYFTNKNIALKEWSDLLNSEKHSIKNCILLDLHNNKNKNHLKMPFNLPINNKCPYDYIHYYTKNNLYYIELKSKLNTKPEINEFKTMLDAIKFWNEFHKNHKTCHLKHIEISKTTLQNKKMLSKNCKLEYAKLYNKNNNYILELKKIHEIMPIKHEFKSYEEAKKLWTFLIKNEEFKHCLLNENIESNELIQINLELNKLNNKLLKVDTMAETDHKKLDFLLNKFMEHSKHIELQHKKLDEKIKKNESHKNQINKINIGKNKLTPLIELNTTNSIVENKLKEAQIRLVQNDIKIIELENRLKENITNNNNNRAIIEDIRAKLLNNINSVNNHNKNALLKINKTLLECKECKAKLKHKNALPMPLYALTNPVSVMEIENQKVGSIITK
jgi:hypothetical protein